MQPGDRGTFAARLADEANGARCFYCGGYPCAEGPDILSRITGGPTQNRWMCMSCSAGYFSYMQPEFAAITEPGFATIRSDKSKGAARPPTTK